MDGRLLRALDRAARRAGASRSAYLSGLVARGLGSETGPGDDPGVREALKDIDLLVQSDPPPAGFNVTRTIRAMRDSR